MKSYNEMDLLKANYKGWKRGFADSIGSICIGFALAILLVVILELL